MQAGLLQINVIVGIGATAKLPGNYTYRLAEVLRRLLKRYRLLLLLRSDFEDWCNRLHDRLIPSQITSLAAYAKVYCCTKLRFSAERSKTAYSVETEKAIGSKAPLAWIGAKPQLCANVAGVELITAVNNRAVKHDGYLVDALK